MRLLLVQLVCGLAMTGILWFVQVVHYPLFAQVGASGFSLYETEHARRTAWVVGPLMCVELVAAALFVLPRFRPAAISTSAAWVGLALLAVIWLSTGLVQAPLHNRLAGGLDAAVISRLVATNWIRTVAWTLRSGLLLVWAAKLLR